MVPVKESVHTHVRIRHLSGSHVGRLDEFPVESLTRLRLGRDPEAEIRFDAEKDDLVSRAHASIVPVAGEPGAYDVVDHDSRNGTYVGNHRVVDRRRLFPGDVIELGPGGPRLEFDLHPRPADSVRPTRIAEAAHPIATREAAAPLPAPGGVGRATVERMVATSAAGAQRRTNLAFAGFAAALIVIVGIAGGLWAFLREPAPVPPPTPAAIAKAVGPATVYIECWWKLILTNTGGQVYHSYLPNPYRMENGKVVRFDRIDGPAPAYIQVSDDKLEPLLTISPEGRPITGGHTGSGFVISSDGFLLTNRHVGASWLTSFGFDHQIGVLVSHEGVPVLDRDGDPVYVQPPADWVPALSRQAGLKLSGGLEGVNDVLDVTFAGQKQRTPAKLARISDEHDVAMLKIDLPEALPYVQVNDNYDTVQPGDRVYVMGYPGVSPAEFGVSSSKDAFVDQSRLRIIPTPTLTEGIIGKVIRPSATGAVGTVTGMNDAYQLTITATGQGNSGGPLLDEQGRVIGIFYASRMLSIADARVTFAVPIRYGKKLMGAR